LDVQAVVVSLLSVMTKEGEALSATVVDEARGFQALGWALKKRTLRRSPYLHAPYDQGRTPVLEASTTSTYVLDPPRVQVKFPRKL
jgi:hypothetical protein